MEYSKYKPSDNQFNVNAIKKCLLSRKLQNKILSTKSLLQFLIKNSSEVSLVKLMNADLVEMLCEASCTTNIILLKYIFQCFFVFIEYDQFFKQNRTAYTLESVIRALYMLIKTEDGSDTVILGLQLVCDIICRLNAQEIMLNTICNLPNLINLVRQWFNTDDKILNIYVGTEVLISLLHGNGIQKFKKIMEDTISEALKLLVDIARKSKEERCIVIMSAVVNGSMRFLVHPKSEAADDITKPTIFLKLISVMEEILVPFLIECQETLHEINFGSVQTILSALLSIYHHPEESATEEFSHFLVTNGFLNFLPLIEAESSEMELVIITRSLLFELLQCISSSVLGKENWKNLLLPGLEALPPGFPYKSILYHKSNEVIPIASIVYNYFCLVSSSKPAVDSEFLKDLSCVILSLSGIPSASVVKATWLVFAVAYLCSSENFNYSKVAMIKLISFIMNCNIDEVYTHHPAVLYWAFCDDSVAQELQSIIIKFWIDENDCESINVLQILLRINRESCLVMMGLMASEVKLSFTIHKILSSTILKSKNDKHYLFDHAWMILPQYLSQFSLCTDLSQYECLTNIMKICCESKSKTMDISLVLRISCLLPGAFAKYFNSFFLSDIKEKLIFDDHHLGILQSTFSFINELILISFEMDDKRVSAVYLRHEAFLNTIELLLSLDNDAIDTSLMQLLTSLIYSQKHNTQKSSKIIHFDVMKLIQLLGEKAELCIATLRFLALYLEFISDKVVLPLVNISLPTAIQLRTLYLQIHMVCVKSEGEVSSYCWLCLKKLLELSDSIGLKEHLSSIPYTSALLLKSCGTKTWNEAASFLPTWLPNLPHHAPRALDIPSSLKTLHKLNDKLAKTMKDHNITKALSKVINFSNKQKIILEIEK